MTPNEIDEKRKLLNLFKNKLEGLTSQIPPSKNPYTNNTAADLIRMYADALDLVKEWR